MQSMVEESQCTQRRGDDLMNSSIDMWLYKLQNDTKTKPLLKFPYVTMILWKIIHNPKVLVGCTTGDQISYT